ncbi:hypothetical protein GJ629_13045 [Halapricum sp. CBA1109]|uniref:hypothetical protein n=1 Tax=Halapricum sp. CBA1109 TaxID=2668068 RepID=UPI0012FAED6E|nr:hypothetical protein [Halapricum sp. CBA1109]MUV90712.1 hypothetical protein [Halapricum sp. CBA1109]
MALESFFRVGFVSNTPPENTLDAFVSLFDSDKQAPKYIRHNEKSITVIGDSNKYGLDVYSKQAHNFAHNNDLVALDFSCSILFDENCPTQQQLEETLDLVRQFYQCIDAEYVFGMHSERIETIGLPENRNGIPSPISDESLSQNHIDYPTWLMLFPPTMVEEYGREWLLELPAEHVEELDDGAILVVSTLELTDCETDIDIAETVAGSLDPIVSRFTDDHTLAERPGE